MHLRSVDQRVWPLEVGEEGLKAAALMHWRGKKNGKRNEILQRKSPGRA